MQHKRKQKNLKGVDNYENAKRKIIDISMFAPCGMNCKVCYKHCYHKNLVLGA